MTPPESTYSLPELLRRWRLGDLTAEQAVGHLLQNIVPLHQRQTEHESRIRRLEEAINRKGQ
jgi:hypothetical protein